ncbi:hypothetical protein A2331_04485 [Candidatus Falkowbacteria bacterium RIFOXYB2_FULL_34_18]|uniref:Uncharacterized protein n=1 Tax=Candidatus Falkowbacteria bacterium RIFOXYD2_FULL_34_120 TaxID=1798007 RepID=A0A1F5TMH4_9BACT|nr:MAG: hypothetical protein A2331_04485 [Candidatus Falkowbacteria bacterium RIFOXYB2_FULL_34_18]OGF30291.1 MAG: hypothetical protein A2500_06865 [Candidatus Falkowbacteria bacterium RIFOXYC12_FULL_34_55]OGF37842.1 MAG: hypothetical protein A2466_03990 [Candidatus Falkowbacteria bacterium RIFOXYC2_FULL_34_220]OGF39603.1 MAG: hypothetical protein A2515_03705 [Candidatus Falkowbacteria bacterium RIFOXYD12_FULL_34_57]OGF40027.1 MAG: hypothetical protein A2531_07435 [Candidatus Falkowbacteria bact
MKKITNIARNTSYFTIALIIQKIITLAYFTFLARYLAPDNLGRYYLAISFSSIFITIVDLGQANILTREVAKAKEGAQRFINIIMAIKLPLIFGAGFLVFALANILHYPPLTRQLIYMSVALMIMDSLSTTFFAAIRGFHNLFWESISSVLTQLIVMILGIVFIYLGFGLKFLMLAMIIGAMFRFLLSSALLVFKWKINIKPVFNFVGIKSFMILTVPFAVFGIYQKLYTYLDTVMLSKLASDYHVGLYQIAFKIIFALQFLPMAFIASLYPAFADYWKNNKDQLLITFERGFNYLTIISVPITVGVMVITDKIMLLFKPEYLASISSLRIIILALPFLFLNFPIGALLNACDKQKVNTRNMGITLMFSIILNIILIPKFNVAGASITVFASNFFMFIIGMISVSKFIKIRPKKLFLPMMKVVLISILMGIFAWYWKIYINIFATILISALIYFMGIYFMGVIKKDDIKSILSSFAKKNI